MASDNMLAFESAFLFFAIDPPEVLLDAVNGGGGGFERTSTAGKPTSGLAKAESTKI